MKKIKFFEVVKKYLYMFLLIISALLIAPTYGYTYYKEQKREQEQLERENQLIQEMLQSNQQQQQEETIVGSNHNKKPETGHVDKKEPEQKPEPTPEPEEEQQPEENTNTGNGGNTGNSGSNGASSGTTSGELCMDVIRTGPTERTLFIGDSRTIGIRLYSRLTNIDYYAVEGVSVYGIWNTTSEVAGLGEVTLVDALQNGEYANIHVLLGINELGSPLDTTAQTYGKFIDDIRSYQPNARIYIAANLHVSQQKSDTHPVFTNDRINYLNNELKKFADNEKVFYLDVNVLFDDANGHLNGDYTSDGVHLRAKYYIPWGQWLMEQFELTK